MADQYRRLSIHYLRDGSEQTATFEEIAEYIDMRGSPDHDDSDIQIRLYHAHFPLLADANLIEYDARSETVVYRPCPLAEEILDTIEESQ